MTHYEVLQVSPTASAEEIRRAYLRLARRHHPDFHVSADAATRAAAERQMRLINEAWAVLADDTRRRDYDRAQRHRRAGPGVAPPRRPGPDGGPSRAFVPFDPSDDPDPADLDDDTPVAGAVSVPRWAQIAPVALLAVAVGALAVSLVTSIRPLLAIGVASLVLSALSFVAVPMVAVMISADRDRA